MPEKKPFWKDGISALAYSSSRIWFIRAGRLGGRSRRLLVKLLLFSGSRVNRK